MGDWLLREAGEEEAGVIAALIRAGFEEYRGRLDPPSGAHAETEATVRDKMKTARAVLALAGTTPIGCVLYQLREDHVYLFRLAVLPEYRCRGLGAALIEYVENLALRRNPPAVRLGVRVALARQRAYYERLGYRPVEACHHPGYAEPTYLILEKQLREP